MFKNQNCSFVFLAGFFILTSQVSNASIENIQSDIGVAQSDIDSPSDVEVVQTNDDAYNSYYSPIQATFTGQVKFEPRYTRVHDCENSGQPCHKSQKYWSLVIVSKGHNYVFNRELNLGEEFAPESVELAGSTLKAGSIVKVDGQVTTAGVTSFFIMNIERVQVIADVGWICHSTSVNNPNVSVRVWYNLTQGAVRI